MIEREKAFPSDRKAFPGDSGQGESRHGLSLSPSVQATVNDGSVDKENLTMDHLSLSATSNQE